MEMEMNGVALIWIGEEPRSYGEEQRWIAKERLGDASKSYGIVRHRTEMIWNCEEPTDSRGKRIARYSSAVKC